LNLLKTLKVPTLLNSHYSKTSLTRTSGDRPRTSVLTEVHVIQKLKESVIIFNYMYTRMHPINARSISIQYMQMSRVTV